MEIKELKQRIDTLREARKELSTEIKRLCNNYYVKLNQLSKDYDKNN